MHEIATIILMSQPHNRLSKNTHHDPYDDTEVREKALNPNQSFIIQAPAGSGKTQLLITRFLTLLCTTSKPESLLCVTFTKKACGEMRTRIHQALMLWQQPKPSKPHEVTLWTLSHKVKQHPASSVATRAPVSKTQYFNYGCNFPTTTCHGTRAICRLVTVWY